MHVVASTSIERVISRAAGESVVAIAADNQIARSGGIQSHDADRHGCQIADIPQIVRDGVGEGIDA